MDINHFGDSAVHEMLSDYLVRLNHPRLSQRSTAMLQQYNTDKKEILESNLSSRMKYILLESLRERYIQNSVNETIMGEDEFLRTLLINAITAGYRKDLTILRSRDEKKTKITGTTM